MTGFLFRRTSLKSESEFNRTLGIVVIVTFSAVRVRSARSVLECVTLGEST